MAQLNSLSELLAQYERDHSHPANVFCHAIGIPLIIVSLLLLPWHWRVALLCFVVGWIFQFVGHWVQGKKPSFFGDWRYLFVGPIFLAQKLRKAVLRLR